MGVYPWTEDGESDVISNAKKWYAEEKIEEDKYYKSIRPKSKLELSLYPEINEEEGDKRLKQIFWLLDNFRQKGGRRVSRNANQVAWHKACVLSCLPKIYG